MIIENLMQLRKKKDYNLCKYMGTNFFEQN